MGNVYTGYFANRAINNIEHNIINISLRPPIRYTKKYISIAGCMPTNDILSRWNNSNKDLIAVKEYITDYYRAVLIKNSKEDWVSLFDTLENNTNGKPSILLCYEKHGTFCHRLVLSKYLELTCGIIIPEFGHPEVADSDIMYMITNTLNYLLDGGDINDYSISSQ